MNTNDQIRHVQPLIDQVAELIRTGQHLDASPRFKVEPILGLNPCGQCNGTGSVGLYPFKPCPSCCPRMAAQFEREQSQAKPEAVMIEKQGRPVKIPAHIIDCAIDIQKWFDQNNIKEWAFMGIQSRREPVEATAQPKAKTALGELAEWLDKVESHYPATGYMRQQLATWAKAVREADEQ